MLLRDTPLGELDYQLPGPGAPFGPLIYWFWPGIRAEKEAERLDFERRYLSGP